MAETGRPAPLYGQVFTGHEKWEGQTQRETVEGRLPEIPEQVDEDERLGGRVGGY